MQATTKDSNVNVAMFQVLQHITVVAVVDRPEAVQNSQNNEIIAIHNIMPIFSMVKAV